MNSSVDTVNLFSYVTPISAWPQEVLQIGLVDYTHAATVCATSNFYRPDSIGRDLATNHFQYTYLATTSDIAVASILQFTANTYPDVLGGAIKWDVERDDERGKWEVTYEHPSIGYGNRYYNWQSQVFCSRVIPTILSATTSSIEISSVLSAPFIYNNSTDGRPWPGTPAASARGITTRSYKTGQFNVLQYQSLVDVVYPIPAFTHIAYSSGGKTESAGYTATNVTGVTQSSWTATLSTANGALPIVPGTVYARADHNTQNNTYSRQFKDDTPVLGEFVWRDQSGNAYSGVSAGGTTTLDYNTAEMTVTFQPPRYFFPYNQTILTFNYFFDDFNGYLLPNELHCTNHKTPANNTMAAFYPTSGADHVTLYSPNVPIYMYDIETQISLDGSTNAAPSANGYTISFTPTAIVTMLSSNVLTISAGYTCNWDPQLFINVVPGYHVVSFENNDKYSLVKYLTGDIANPSTLSAYNTLNYQSFIAGTNYLTISSPITAARYDNVTYVTLSSIDGSIHEIVVPWTINPDNWTLDVIMDKRDNSSAVCHAEIICSQPIDVRQIQWGSNPSDNVIFRSMANGEVIPHYTTVAWATASAVSVQNLGIEMTSICITSIDPLNLWATNYSGCTYWSPTSWNDVSFQIRADFLKYDNKDLIKTLPLSALIVKNGLFYPLPNTSTITWQVTSDPSLRLWGVSGSDSNDQIFRFNTGIDGSVFDVVTAYIQAPTVMTDPKTYEIPLWATVTTPYFTRTTNVPTYVVYADDFPGVNLLSVSVSSNYDSVDYKIATFNSNRTHDIFVPVSATNLTFEDVSVVHGATPARYPLLTRTWHLSSDQGTTVYTTTGSILDVTLTPSQSSVSAVVLSVDYYSDGWRALHTQQLPVYIHFIDQIPSVTADAFPSLMWVAGSSVPVELTFSNYSSSQGVTAYGNCHSETVYISAGPSEDFTSFRYQFGDVFTSSPSATAANLMYCPLTCVQTLGVSAYNAVITIDTPLLYYDIYGARSSLVTTLTSTSNTTNPLWHDMMFVSYPSVTSSVSSVDAPDFALGAFDRPVLDLDVYYDLAPHMSVVNATTNVTIYVGGAQPYSFDYSNPITEGHNEVLAQFQVIDPNHIHYLNSTAATPMTAVVTRSFTQQIEYRSYAWCPETTNATTTIYFNAWPSPIIELFNSSTVGCINTPITIYNATAPTIASVQYDAYAIDMGNGTIQTIAGSATELTATYTDTGTYYLNVSGIQDGQTIAEETFGPLIVFADCNKLVDQYDATTTRRLEDQLQLPHACDDLTVQNEWVTKDVFNSLVQKTTDNLQYVIDNCTMYEPILPLSYIGWYGSWTQSITNKWNLNTQSKFAYDQAANLLLQDVRSVAWDSTYNIVHIVRGDAISMHAYDHAMNRISPIIELPLFDIQGCTLISNKLYVVDKFSNGVYSYDVVPYSATPYRLAQYFADFGDANTKQGLSEPSDISNDGQRIFVTDANNYCVKVYNGGLAWIGQFSHGDFNNSTKPISIATSDDYIFVAATNKTVYKFDVDTFAFVEKWSVNVAIDRIRTYDKQLGFVTILSDKMVIRYTHTGVIVGTFSQPVDQPLVDLCYNDTHTVLLAGPDKLFAAIDIVATKTIRTDAFDSILWPESQLKIDRNEMVTAWVYNSILKKLWDNINTIDKSIHSKFAQFSTPATTDVNFAIMTTTSAEAVVLDDSQLLIGNNELVTSHVLERSFKTLCRAIEQLKSRITVDLRVDPCVSNLCWTWEALKGNRTPYSQNCATNPITWFELQDNVPTTFNKRWCDAISSSCGCEQPVWDGLVLDNAITYLRIGGSVLVLR